MWSEILLKDVDDLTICTRIMSNMDHVYARLSDNWLRALIVKDQARIFLYRDGDAKVLVVMTFNKKLGLHRVYTVGFDGPISAKDVLDIGTAKIASYFKEQNTDRGYTIRRRGLDNHEINEVLAGIDNHPLFHVEVLHVMNDRDSLLLRLARTDEPIPVSS